MDLEARENGEYGRDKYTRTQNVTISVRVAVADAVEAQKSSV